MNLPEMVRVKQNIETPEISDIALAVSSELERIDLPRLLRPGMQVAVAVGSRGISNLPIFIRSIVGECRKLQAVPFVIPAMGSHGGATAEGQRRVLASLGVTELAIGCPIVAKMDVVEIGKTREGIPVVIDKSAAEADGIIIFNRIKEHTDFRGALGSGLMKMLTIGLGKCEGATCYHKWAFDLGYYKVVSSVARTVMSNARILLGMGVVENSDNRSAYLVAVKPENLEAVEEEYLAKSKSISLKLPAESIDILIVDKLGKEISGSGMDSNVIGRNDIGNEPPPTTPRITRIVARDLTEETHGNAVGLGMADFITRRLAKKVNFNETYINAIVGFSPQQGRLPIVAETDLEAIQWALGTIGRRGARDARVVWIRSTADLKELLISNPLFGELQGKSTIEVLSQAAEMKFDEWGNLEEGFPTS
jgi:hypothetical protein